MKNIIEFFFSSAEFAQRVVKIKHGDYVICGRTAKKKQQKKQNKHGDKVIMQKLFYILLITHKWLKYRFLMAQLILEFVDLNFTTLWAYSADDKLVIFFFFFFFFL